jgi:hypothetical protein
VKKPMVIGMSGKTQGVRLRASPARKTPTRRRGRDFEPRSDDPADPGDFATTPLKSSWFAGFEELPGGTTVTSTPVRTSSGGRHWVLLHACAVTVTRKR